MRRTDMEGAFRRVRDIRLALAALLALSMMASRRAAATIFPASATATNFCNSLRRSNMGPRFARPGRQIEYGISMKDAAAIACSRTRQP